MRLHLGSVLLLTLLAACAEDDLPGETALAVAVPAEIAVPSDQHITLEAHGFGVQVYECTASSSGARTWAFRAPAALLVADSGQLVATHFGGIDVGLPAGVYWQSILDGSRVHGGKAIFAPNPGAIPLVRLESLDNAGHGIFEPTTFIQRLNTVGGVAPTGSCPRVGRRVAVPYQADYVFYAAGQPRPSTPATIAVDPTHNLAHVLHAEGVQTYQCTADTAGALGWTFRAPTADLFDDDGRLVVKHFGGIDKGLPAGAYWQSVKDGSRVHAGNAVAAPGATSGAIALLRLATLDTAGTGILSRVSFVQRLATVGGVGPTGACAPLDARVAVPYAADYFFYIPQAQATGQ